MPMVGHNAEVGLVVGHEFREGNAAPAAGNLEFLQARERNMPEGGKISAGASTAQPIRRRFQLA